jgi:hypothetical protein
MKKILIALSFLAVAVSAQAQHHGHHSHHGYHQRSGNWVAPAIVGGVIGYALTRNYYEPVYNYGYVPPPVIVQRTVIVPSTGQVCTPWTETQTIDGNITRTRTCQ